MSRKLEQHPTPPELADRVVALARQHFGAETRLWLEPCCGEGALLTRLPEPRIGVEIDAAIARDPVRCGDCMALRPADLGDVPRDAVCVVTNPPFNGAAPCEGTNRIAAYSSWLPAFLTHMATLAATGVFILPRGATAKRWWRDTVAAQPDIVVALEPLGRVHFAGTAHAGVDVVLAALRLPSAWTSSWVTPARIAELEAAIADDMELVNGGSPAANAMVLIWGSPQRIGEYTFDEDTVCRRQDRLPRSARVRRQGSTHVFLYVHRRAEAERRLAHMRALVAERYRGAKQSSACITISELLECCASL